MNKGQVQFRDWLSRRFPNSRSKARDAANLLGWDEAIISKIVNGSRRPGLDNAVTLERATGIPAELWLESCEDESSESVSVSSVKRSRTR